MSGLPLSKVGAIGPNVMPDLMCCHWAPPRSGAHEAYRQGAYAALVAEPRSDRLQLRVSPRQRMVIQRAAEASHEPVTDYVVRHAVSAAKNDLADRRYFELDDAAWGELQTLLDRPAVREPALEDLFAQPELWVD